MSSHGPEPEPRPFVDVEAAVEQAQAARLAIRRRRRWLTLGVPVLITTGWLVAVTVTGNWGRVTDRWVATLTMVFGSFVAGSTPQGGGAVAFPVFTKALAVPSEVARTFSLSIQTFGMGAATATILLARRRLDWGALGITLPSALVGFGIGAFLFSRRGDPFMPSVLPGPYVRVTFTILVAAMALVVVLQFRSPLRAVRRKLPSMNGRVITALVIFGLLGGVVSAQVGSGADVLFYSLVVATLGVDPPIGVATSVVVMACVSIVGLASLGVVNGQLAVGLSPDGTMVESLGGRQVALSEGRAIFVDEAPADAERPPARRYDLFGLWLAAIPAACWAGPAGAWFASRMKARSLVLFVLVLASLELITTAIFLEPLRRDLGLVLYTVVLLGVVSGGLMLLSKHRRRIFRLPAASPEATLTAEHMEARLGFERVFDIDREEPRDR